MNPRPPHASPERPRRRPHPGRTRSGLAGLLPALLITGLAGHLVFVPAVDAQDAPGPGGAPPPGAGAPNGTPPAAPKESLFELLTKGGPVMFPLALCSIIALAITVERGISLRRNRIIPPGFFGGLGAVFDGRPGTVPDALAFCGANDSPAARVFRAAVAQIPRGRDAVEKAMEDAGGREADRLKRSLRGLQVVASVSPLLGLLGTVYGMIGAFQTAHAGVGRKAEQLAGGIYEALVTTAAGLTIAIPTLLVYQYFNYRNEVLVDEIDDLGNEFDERYLNGPDDGGSTPSEAGQGETRAAAETGPAVEAVTPPPPPTKAKAKPKPKAKAKGAQRASKRHKTAGAAG